MQAANVLAQHIDLVVPHGTGTPLNDRIEGQMLAELLGDRLPTVALMPIKAHIGHCAGASGIFSVVAAAQALASGQTPPTLHLTEQQADPECALALHAQAQSLPAAGGCHALVNAYGFGGNNISMVLQGVLHA